MLLFFARKVCGKHKHSLVNLFITYIHKNSLYIKDLPTQSLRVCMASPNKLSDVTGNTDDSNQ